MWYTKPKSSSKNGAQFGLQRDTKVHLVSPAILIEKLAIGLLCWLSWILLLLLFLFVSFLFMRSLISTHLIIHHSSSSAFLFSVVWLFENYIKHSGGGGVSFFLDGFTTFFFKEIKGSRIFVKIGDSIQHMIGKCYFVRKYKHQSWSNMQIQDVILVLQRKGVGHVWFGEFLICIFIEYGFLDSCRSIGLFLYLSNFYLFIYLVTPSHQAMRYSIKVNLMEWVLGDLKRHHFRLWVQYWPSSILLGHLKWKVHALCVLSWFLSTLVDRIAWQK